MVWLLQHDELKESSAVLRLYFYIYSYSYSYFILLIQVSVIALCTHQLLLGPPSVCELANFLNTLTLMR